MPESVYIMFLIVCLKHFSLFSMSSFTEATIVLEYSYIMGFKFHILRTDPFL